MERIFQPALCEYVGMDDEILHNLDQRVFYHGTKLEAAEAIVEEGFRMWFHDEEWGGTGATTLGNGQSVGLGMRPCLMLFGPC